MTRIRLAIASKVKTEVDDVYFWECELREFTEQLIILPFGMTTIMMIIGFIGIVQSTEDSGWKERNLPMFLVCTSMFLVAVFFYLIMVFSPISRLNADIWPSIQPRREGSLPSIDALERLSWINLHSIFSRILLHMRSFFTWVFCIRNLFPEQAGAESLHDIKLTSAERSFMLCCTYGEIETVQTLIEARVNLNTKTRRGTTALMLAAYGQQPDVVEKLIETGADPCAKSIDGTTALMMACTRMSANGQETIRIILDALPREHVNSAKCNGVTALMITARFMFTAYMNTLVIKGADTELKTYDNYDVHMIADAAKFSGRPERMVETQNAKILLSQAQAQQLSPREATEGDIQLSSGDYVQILYDDELGHGNFGTVYEGRMRGMRVAVKQLLVQDSRNYQRELGALSALGNSERVVKFYGSVRNGNIAYIVMEYCSFSLFGYLHNSDDDPLDAETILRWMSQLAEGIQFLHAKDLVHRDIKTHNVLVENDQIKIADFGLAKAFRRADSAASMTNYAYAQGTFEYMAPELFDPPSFGLSRGSEYTHKSDVYAFGVVLWECATRQKPYAEVEHVLALAQMVPKGERPRGGLRTELPGDYAELMSQCWHQERRERPSADEIVERLHVMYNEL